MLSYTIQHESQDYDASRLRRWGSRSEIGALYQVLLGIDEGVNLSAGKLASMALVKRPEMSTTLALMEALGFIKREFHDGRSASLTVLPVPALTQLPKLRTAEHYDVVNLGTEASESADDASFGRLPATASGDRAGALFAELTQLEQPFCPAEYMRKHDLTTGQMREMLLELQAAELVRTFSSRPLTVVIAPATETKAEAKLAIDGWIASGAGSPAIYLEPRDKRRPFEHLLEVYKAISKHRNIEQVAFAGDRVVAKRICFEQENMPKMLRLLAWFVVSHVHFTQDFEHSLVQYGPSLRVFERHLGAISIEFGIRARNTDSFAFVDKMLARGGFDLSIFEGDY